MIERTKRIWMATWIVFLGATGLHEVRADPYSCEHYEADMKLLKPLADAFHFNEIFRQMLNGSVCPRAAEHSLLMDDVGAHAPPELSSDLNTADRNAWQFSVESVLELLVPAAHLHGKDVECLEALDTYTKLLRERKRKLTPNCRSEIDRLLPLFTRHCAAGCKTHRGPSCDSIRKSQMSPESDENAGK